MNPIIQEIRLAEFDLSLSGMRIMNMQRILQVEKSMRLNGQLQAVVARVHEGGYQLIDGFKRYYAAEGLMMETLQCLLLEKYRDITGQRVYEHLKEKNYDGEITIVREYLKSIRQVGSKTPVRLVETDPGQRGAHDWSDYTDTFTSTAKAEQVTFLSYILSYSRGSTSS